jgi:hypothetical protein
MARIGFFEMLVHEDISWLERNAINSAHDRADAALNQGEMLGSSIGALQQTIRAQQAEIAGLKAALSVLAHVLEDAGVVDRKVLDYRIEAAIEDAQEAAEAARAGETVQCVGCSQTVPKARSNVTELGLMCDRCAASR